MGTTYTGAGRHETARCVRGSADRVVQLDTGVHVTGCGEKRQKATRGKSRQTWCGIPRYRVQTLYYTEMTLRVCKEQTCYPLCSGQYARRKRAYQNNLCVYLEVHSFVCSSGGRQQFAPQMHSFRDPEVWTCSSFHNFRDNTALNIEARRHALPVVAELTGLR